MARRRLNPDEDTFLIRLLVIRGWSQSGIAKAIGVSPAFVSMIATGKRKASEQQLAELQNLWEREIINNKN